MRSVPCSEHSPAVELYGRCVTCCRRQAGSEAVQDVGMAINARHQQAYDQRPAALPATTCVDGCGQVFPTSSQNRMLQADVL